MARNKRIKSAMNGFLGTYTGRYTAFNHYWLLGFLVKDLVTRQIDLLASAGDEAAETGTGQQHKAWSIAEQLAKEKFRDQVMKAGCTIERVKSATLHLEKDPVSHTCYINDIKSYGHWLTVRVKAETTTGGIFAVECTLLVAQHNPRVEWQSSPRM